MDIEIDTTEFKSKPMTFAPDDAKRPGNIVPVLLEVDPETLSHLRDGEVEFADVNLTPSASKARGDEGGDCDCMYAAMWRAETVKQNARRAEAHDFAMDILRRAYKNAKTVDDAVKIALAVKEVGYM